MTSRFDFQFPPRAKPGLFIASLEAHAGKTVVACAIANWFARRSARVGVLKPIALDCRAERETLVSPEAEALAHFADFDPAIGGLPVIAPIPFKRDDAPAVALALRRQPFEAAPIARSLTTLDQNCHVVIVESVGGLMEPIHPDDERVTSLDLAIAMGYPLAIVAGANRRSLNLASLAAASLRAASVRPAGVIINQYEPDDPDPATQMNRELVAKILDAPVLATVPRVPSRLVDVFSGVLADDVHAAIGMMNWSSIARPPKPKD